MRVARTRVAPHGAALTGQTARLAMYAFVITMSFGCGHGDASEPYTPVGPNLPVVPPADPKLGSLAVRTMTSGARLDPDGYVVRFGGEWDYIHERTRVPTNGTVGVFLPPGEYPLTLLDVATNCEGEGLIDRSIIIVAGAVTEVVFQLLCGE